MNLFYCHFLRVFLVIVYYFVVAGRCLSCLYWSRGESSQSFTVFCCREVKNWASCCRLEFWTACYVTAFVQEAEAKCDKCRIFNVFLCKI